MTTKSKARRAKSRWAARLWGAGAVVLGVLCSSPFVPRGDAQQKPDAVLVQPPGAQPGVLITPIMKSEDLLIIRNLQYQQDKKLIEMQKLAARYKELEAGISEDTRAINDAVRVGANAAKVDLTKFIFDLDSLKFLPRAGSATNPKPEEKRQ